MPGQEQETAVVVEQQPPELGGADGVQAAPTPSGDWEAYSLDVLNDLLDS